MEADNSSDVYEDTTLYCSIREAMKLIAHSIDGDKRKFREFIENVNVVFELVDPSKHDVLLKSVKAKITGDARSKLMVRVLCIAPLYVSLGVVYYTSLRIVRLLCIVCT
jgi:hypothetical protein